MMVVMISLVSGANTLSGVFLMWEKLISFYYEEHLIDKWK